MADDAGAESGDTGYDALAILRKKTEELSIMFELLPGELKMDGLDIIQDLVNFTIKKITGGKVSSVKFTPVQEKKAASDDIPWQDISMPNSEYNVSPENERTSRSVKSAEDGESPGSPAVGSDSENKGDDLETEMNHPLSNDGELVCHIKKEEEEEKEDVTSIMTHRSRVITPQERARRREYMKKYRKTHSGDHEFQIKEKNRRDRNRKQKVDMTPDELAKYNAKHAVMMQTYRKKLKVTTEGTAKDQGSRMSACISKTSAKEEPLLHQRKRKSAESLDNEKKCHKYNNSPKYNNIKYINFIK